MNFKLEKYEINQALLNWIKNFSHDRIQKGIVNESDSDSD